MFVPDFLGGGVGKHPRGKLSFAEAGAQTPGEVHHDRPIVAGAGTAGRTRLMARSELVTVPSFSPQVLAGRRRSA